ncbi:MAG: glycosyltransferase family 4 protein [Steroidobacterales bacterium]
MLRVAQIGFFIDPRQREPQQLLHDWPTMVDVAQAACGGGAQVSVIQASSRAQTLTQRDITYHFLAPHRHASGIARGSGLRRLIRDLNADVLHVHGLGFPHEVLALAKLAPRTPMLLQDHADQPPRKWRRPLWRRCLSAASGLCFCAKEQAMPFRDAGLVSASTVVYEVPEGTSHFAPGDQAQAQRATGLHGDPCVLWVGHLNENKDPLTVLDGVSAAAERLPGLRLWCYFGSAPLLAAVQRRIAQDPRLAARTRLMGSVPHEQIQQVMRAADLFVLGSRREGSGYALLEAMACGVPPVVSDIPAFRALTGDAMVGELWPCGSAQRLALALVSIWMRSGKDLRASVRAHFDRELSIAAIGRKLNAVYRDMLDRRSGALMPRRECSSSAR